MRSFGLAGAVLLVGFGSLVACGGGDDEGGGGGGGSCVPQSADCYVAGPSGPGGACMAKADNGGQAKWQGRFTAIYVESPANLATSFVQENVLDKGINLNLKSCNEFGDGTFTWLFELDPTTKRLKTGGGLPVIDAKAPGCFVNFPSAALAIAPIEVDVNLDADNKHLTASGIDVNVPIFTTPTDTTNPIILPLHSVTLDATFADDSHNCIGKYNGDILDPVNSCKPDTKAIPPERAWTTGGELQGYITTAEADKVFIDELGATLCVLLGGLTDGWKGTNNDCASSDKWIAGERPAGDWCSTTDQPADASCSDAFRLKGKFAAAAFSISGDCP